MNASAPYIDVYTDLQGFSGLRKSAREDSPQALREVAKQFEALFMQMMLKSMRKASFGDPLFDSSSSLFYRDMFDQQLSLELAKKQGMGLADMLVEQLQGGMVGTGKEEKATIDNERLPLNIRRAPFTRPESSFRRVSAADEINAHSEVKEVKEVNEITGPPKFDSKEAFIEILMPHAAHTARSLGVDPGVLLAQAALETGWGQSIMRRHDGQSSYNLFGIKADNRWSGGHTVVSTLEYLNGLAVKKQARFRAYSSFGDSFNDYADFLRSGSRYSGALAVADDSPAFIRALGEAGYATDPKYAEKILRIWRGDLSGGLKLGKMEPLYK
ncbi:MAG: flagellar assembly peptidoglycan hydrolase FlgJ [Gammaproteobacteria bacterium]|nr:flagellar assembly peptidoglycan hydrolase FlgJ [Gammaproteobacteria bacterium]